MTGKKPKPSRLLDAAERREELTRAPRSDPEDAAPRIEVSPGTGGATRIDVADTAVVRPGRPS
jgi:hypothetical protein